MFSLHYMLALGTWIKLKIIENTQLLAASFPENQIKGTEQMLTLKKFSFEYIVIALNVI